MERFGIKFRTKNQLTELHIVANLSAADETTPGHRTSAGRIYERYVRAIKIIWRKASTPS